MKKYDLSNLSVIIKNDVKMSYDKTYLICENHINQVTQQTYWIEIFTGQKTTSNLRIGNNVETVPFSYYFKSLIESNKGRKFSKTKLLYCYNELNKIQLLRSIDEIDIEEYLTHKKRFEYSKIHIKDLHKKI